MSARALNWAWEQVPTSKTAKLILVALADRADDDGVCWPSQKWLARKCRPMGVDGVRRAYASLVAEGLIVKEERIRRDDGTLSTWMVRLPIDSQSAETPTGPVGTSADAYSKNTTSTSDEVDGTPTVQKRDLVWDALVEQFGAVADRTQAHGKRNKAVGDLKRLGATPESIAAALKAWPKLYEGATVTDVALATHYPQLLQAAGWKDGQPTRAKPCPECGVGGGLHVADCTRAAVAA